MQKLTHKLKGITGYGLSLAWLVAVLGTAVSLFINRYDSHFIDDFGTFIKILIFGLSFVIYGQFALFYYDAYSDVREGIPRPDVTIERFIFVMGLIGIVFATSAALMDNLQAPPTWRIPIYIFSYLIIIYGMIKRQQHYTQPLFVMKDEDERSTGRL